jgi:hypothetical protein
MWVEHDPETSKPAFGKIMLGLTKPTGPAASSMTPGRWLRFIQLLVAEVGRWFQKTNQLFCIAQMPGYY